MTQVEQIINDLVVTFIYFRPDSSPSENILMNGSVQFNYCFPLRFSIMKQKDNSSIFVKWQCYKDEKTGEYREVNKWNTFNNKELVTARKKEIEEQIIEDFLRRYPTYANMINSNVQILRGNVSSSSAPSINVNVKSSPENDVPLISIQTKDDIPFEDDDELFQRMLSQNED
jgi:hypothetical protein